jgi:import receptor subunit TOM70
VSFVNESIDQGISFKEGQAEAYNLRATFKFVLPFFHDGGADDRFLIGDSEGAKTDLEKSLDILPSFVQSWVKIASVHMELGKLKKADCRRKLTSRRPS